MKKSLLFALSLLLLVQAVALSPSAMAKSSDNNSTQATSGTSVSLEPLGDNVIPTTTRVEPSTTKIEPLKTAATPGDSVTPAPSVPHIPIIAGLAVLAIAIIVTLNFKRQRRKFPRLRILSSLALVGLLMMPVGQIYGEETLNVSIWGGLDSIIGLPMIIRESIDSAGKVWFGSFWAARIGCLDPSTNEVKMWIVPETSGVQTVSVDYADKVWLTALSRIGRFDPSTNFFTVWPITGVSYWTGVEPFAFPLVSLDSHGDAFFPELDTNKIGRINPATNELTEWVIPTSDSKPGYTMVDANGNVWFAELAGNKIGRLNPYTNEITEWNIPTPGSGPSGLHVAGGLVYFAEYHSNKIGRLNPSTNEMTQWSISIYSAYGPYGLFVDSSGDAWFTALYWRGTYEAPGNYLCRLGIDNILTCWTPELLISSYGVTVDTKMNVGDVYVSGWYVGSYAVLRFRPATP